MAQTKIEWAERTWNPVTGCTKVSPACDNCYAERMAKRLAGRFGYPKDKPFKVTLHPDRLDEPLKWRKPSRVFVVSMGDLFHPKVPEYFIVDIWKIILAKPQHTFMILTKRPERALKLIGKSTDNIWLGVTAENQEQYDKRVPILLQIPAALHFISIEPMLEPIDLCLDIYTKDGPYPEWVILGAESGPKRRKIASHYIQDVVYQCKSAGVPVFVKQIHDVNGEVSKDILKWPPDLRIRQYPEGV